MSASICRCSLLAADAAPDAARSIVTASRIRNVRSRHITFCLPSGLRLPAAPFGRVPRDSAAGRQPPADRHLSILLLRHHEMVAPVLGPGLLGVARIERELLAVGHHADAGRPGCRATPGRSGRTPRGARPSARLYSAVPRSSQCPSIVITHDLYFFITSALPSRIFCASPEISELSKPKNTGLSGEFLLISSSEADEHLVLDDRARAASPAAPSPARAAPAAWSAPAT